MKIAIDISQIVHEGTGVASYVRKLVTALLTLDRKNDYILFGSSLRKRAVFDEFFRSLQKVNARVRLVSLPIPPTLLEMVWNRLHIVPAEVFVGRVDIFWSSDWVQPPLRWAKGITTVHDIIALKFPESSDTRIIAVHRRRLAWVKKECHAVLCDSEATLEDCVKLLDFDRKNLHVVYPGGVQ